MSPETEDRRPSKGRAASEMLGGGSDSHTTVRPTVREARRQRRLQAEYERHVVPDRPLPVSSYGMSSVELAEHRALMRREYLWADWELDARFPDPRDVAA